MLIARINRTTAKVCVNVHSMCEANELLWDGKTMKAVLHITRAGCGPRIIQRTVTENCCTRTEVEVLPTKTWIYPTFDIDANGRTCFYFDKKFLTADAGRYDADITVQGQSIAKFQLDLTRQVAVDSIAIEPECAR